MFVFKGLGRTDGSLLVYFNKVWLGRDLDTLGVAEGGVLGLRYVQVTSLHMRELDPEDLSYSL